jgi:nicotinate-nucleotide adenylyltransferase
MKRVGLLGGSFNPAHRGHRRISLAAIEALGLDEVWWLVSPGNPLKSANDMAPFDSRLASARRMARRAPIKASDFEKRAGTRFTIDTLAALLRRYPRHRFVWLMGSDTVPQFHRWKAWRGIARTVPIAVISRPGYDSGARAARAMGWLRAFVRPSSQARKWTEWSAPAILLLRLPPDPTSATAFRALNPDWHRSSQSRPSSLAERRPSAAGKRSSTTQSFDRSPLARSSSR